jgi:hypothetical protein
MFTAQAILNASSTATLTREVDVVSNHPSELLGDGTLSTHGGVLHCEIWMGAEKIVNRARRSERLSSTRITPNITSTVATVQRI